MVMCDVCGHYKPLNGDCLTCRSRTPVMKARAREYRQLHAVELKARKREYRQRHAVELKARAREYYQRPVVKAKRREYMREYMRKYNRSEAVK